MKTLFLAFAVAAATLMSGLSAQAGFVNGTIAFSGTAANDTSGTVLDTRAVTGVVVNGGKSGDFLSIPNFTVSWGGFTFTNPMPASNFSISSPVIGTFTGALVSDSGASNVTGGNGSRTITYSGSFTGGSHGAFTGKQDPTFANLTITLTQVTAGPNTSFTPSLNLATFGSAAVPEPTSMAIFGLGAIGIAARRFRRK